MGAAIHEPSEWSAYRSPAILRWHFGLSFAIGLLCCMTICFGQDPRKVLTDAVTPFVERGELAGAVMLVADNNRVLAHDSIGWADIASRDPMKKDSLFWIASQSKPITAAALMMLVDEGKVELDQPVEKYLPEFRKQMVIVEKGENEMRLQLPRHPITVREILSHTSGLPFKTTIEDPTLDVLPLASRVRSYAATSLEFQPGSQYLYSNAGINTAARIIEVVSGQSFQHFLDQRLLEPLGMKDTSFWPTAEQVKRLAKSYKTGDNKLGLVETPVAQLFYPLTDRVQRFPMPAGGLFSTATDVAKFYQMLLNEGQANGRRYLSVQSVHELTRRQTPEGINQNYGLGFQLGPDTFGHGGAYATNSIANRKSGLILIWLVQHASFPGEGAKAQEAFRHAAAELFDKRP
jgi:CubicO group peptidase (beta-lactamase class C family)